MKDLKKPLKPSKSLLYDVYFNAELITKGNPDLEQAIKFAYGLHVSTLSVTHVVSVQSSEESLIKAIFAQFMTSDYYGK